MQRTRSVVLVTLAASAALAGDGPCLNWEPVSAPSMPPARYAAAMAYDPVRDVVLLYGGATSYTQHFGDFWQWDGETWTEIAQPELNPGARYSMKMVFDESTGKMMLFSGLVRSMFGTYAVGDLWSWDGSAWTREWVQTSNEYRGRIGCALVYDNVRDTMVVHGGMIVGTDYFGVMRSVNERAGAVWTTPNTGTGISPGYINWHAGWFDPQTQRTLVIGQNGFPTSELCEFWSWDGAVWTQFHVPTPLSRNGTYHGYDHVRDRFIMSGGSYDGAQYDETWTWDGAAWTKLNTSPTPNRGAAYCIDGDGRLITFGGYGFVGNPPPATNEMWRLAPAPLLGDIDGDAHVGMSDLMTVVDSINTSGVNLPGDINDDGAVTFADLNIVVSNYNETCP